MTIEIDNPALEAELKARAEAENVPLNALAERLLGKKFVSLSGWMEGMTEEEKQRRRTEAVSKIHEIRQRSSLGTLKVRDLIDEGRKY